MWPSWLLCPSDAIDGAQIEMRLGYFLFNSIISVSRGSYFKQANVFLPLVSILKIFFTTMEENKWCWQNEIRKLKAKSFSPHPIYYNIQKSESESWYCLSVPPLIHRLVALFGLQRAYSSIDLFFVSSIDCSDSSSVCM